MENDKEFEELLYRAMSPDHFNAPSLVLVNEARRKVMSRKKIENAPGFISRLLVFFNTDLKFYHVGISAILIFAGAFYISEPNYNHAGTAQLMALDNEMSIKNTTISVTSSTMLTSIPTMVIRN